MIGERIEGRFERAIAFVSGTGEPEMNLFFAAQGNAGQPNRTKCPSATGIVYVLEPKDQNEPTAIYTTGEYAPGLTNREAVLKAVAQAARELDPLVKQGCVIDLVADPLTTTIIRTLKNSPERNKEQIENTAIAVAAFERGWFEPTKIPENFRQLPHASRELFRQEVERIKHNLQRSAQEANAIFDRFANLSEELKQIERFAKNYNVFIHSTAEARTMLERENKDPHLAHETLRAAQSTARLVLSANSNPAAREKMLLNHETKIAKLWELAARDRLRLYQQNKEINFTASPNPTNRTEKTERHLVR